MPSVDGPLLVLPAPSLKAKVVAEMRTRRMKLKSQRRPKTLEAQPLEITGTKKFEIAKLIGKRSAQMRLVAVKDAQNEGEAKVLFLESSPCNLTLLKSYIIRVRPLASTTLADCVF